MTKLKQSGGFTLLEVLIVVAIIIIIAGIALPRFLGVSEQGRRARVAGDLRVLQTAVESYILNTNVAPKVGTDLENGLPQVVSNFSGDFKDPFTTETDAAKVQYKLSFATNTTNGKKFYAAYSVGPNGKDDTTKVDDAGKLTAGGDDIFVTNAK